MPSFTASPQPPTRHPQFSFTDGTIAVLAENRYFLVHKGFLARHSPRLALAIKERHNKSLLEGRPVLKVQDTPDDIYQFLVALYDGISKLKYDARSFDLVATLLRMSTKYQVSHLRKDLLRGLSASWPTRLLQWDTRESLATDSDGVYEPGIYPHPILVINLARYIEAPEILPAAFYDLSRYSPSHSIAGHVTGSLTHRLSREDVIRLLKGREHASRFLSTFIVNQLEGRTPVTACVYQKYPDVSRKRACQAAYEALTFEILRDANDVLSHRTSDPLFSILNADLLQSKSNSLGAQHMSLRPCEHCRSEFSSVVESAREHFWRYLPEWFSVDVPSWG